MADYYGYNKSTYGPGAIASTSAVLVKINGSTVNLAQSCNITYSRQVQPNYELGSDSVYLTAGHSGGTAEISRMVGEQAALVPYKTGACDMTKLTIAKGSAQCAKDIGMITGEGLLTQVGIQLNVGQFTVTDSATYTLGNLVI